MPTRLHLPWWTLPATRMRMAALRPRLSYIHFMHTVLACHLPNSRQFRLAFRDTQRPLHTSSPTTTRAVPYRLHLQAPSLARQLARTPACHNACYLPSYLPFWPGLAPFHGYAIHPRRNTRHTRATCTTHRAFATIVHGRIHAVPLPPLPTTGRNTYKR